VPSGDNMVILEISASGKACHVSLDLWSQTGFESGNESGEKDGIVYTMRHFDSPELDWPSHVALAMNTIDAKGKTFELKPSAKVTVVIGICTNHDIAAYFEKAILLASLLFQKIYYSKTF